MKSATQCVKLYTFAGDLQDVHMQMEVLLFPNLSPFFAQCSIGTFEIEGKLEGLCIDPGLNGKVLIEGLAE